MINIKPVSQIEQYLKVLIYGDPGVGKTVLAATAQRHPKMQETLVVNIEGGILSIAGSGAMATDQIRDVTDVEALMWKLANRSEGFEDYQTVVVDSGTELQTLDLEAIVKSSIKKKQQNDRDPDDIYIEDYGKSTARLKRIFRHFRDLPMNVIITALVKREMPDQKEKKKAKHPTYVGPQFTTKLANSLMGYMDAVWYMYKNDAGNRELLTQSHGAYVAKTRGINFSQAIGERVENPDLSELYSKLLETEGAFK